MASPNQTPAPPAGALLRPEEAARVLRVSLRYLRQLSQRGLIASVRIGRRATRYMVADVAQFIDRRRRESVSPPFDGALAAEPVGEAPAKPLEDAPPSLGDHANGRQPNSPRHGGSPQDR